MTSRAIVGAILCALAGIAAADTLEGRIVGVADGDTLTLLDGDNRQHRIRLDGIDAPEKGQAFGERSRGLRCRRGRGAAGTPRTVG